MVGGETTSDMVSPVRDAKEVSDDESKDVDNLSEKK